MSECTSIVCIYVYIICLPNIISAKACTYILARKQLHP
jgi:hypothetical protein